MEGALELANTACMNDIPGFQVIARTANQCGMLALIDIAEQAAKSTWNQSLVMDSYVKQSFTVHGQAHVDGSFVGLAIHRNLSDFGKVYLASRIKGARYSEEPEFLPQYGNRHDGLFFDCTDIGVVHEGQLSPGVVTFFSEGFIGAMLPVVHLFARDANRTHFERFASTRGVLTMSAKQRVTAKQAMLARAALV